MTNSGHRKKLPSSNDGETYWKGVVLPSAKYVRSRSNRHERRINRHIAKSREHSNEKKLENTKIGCTSSN